MQRGLGRVEGTVALGALAIVVCGAVIGLLYNHFSAHPLPLFASEATLRPAVGAGVSYIDVGGAKSMLDAQSAVFVDARATEEYAEGHIPGAISVPADDFEQAYPRAAEALRGAAAIVCYCESLTCEQSAQVAEELAARGHTNVLLMFSGWEEWEAAGYPIEGSRPQ